MNYRDYIVYDFETTSPNKDTTQPVQIAAVAVHGRKLEIIPGSEFESLVKPIFDEEECLAKGLDPLQDGAVAIHGKTKEILETAPELPAVWKNFTEYVNQYNFKSSAWTAPVSVGYNNKGFDQRIVERVCTEDPYNLGPIDPKRGTQNLFNQFYSLDVMDMMFQFFENDKEVTSLSADNLVRGHMGYEDKKGHAHDALSDVIMTAELFIRAQTMIRRVVGKKKFKGAFSC